MTTPVQTYRNALLLALRERDVPGRRIAEALAEVDSHLAETGEAPEEAFGPAQEYARELVAALGGDGPAPTSLRDVLRGTGLAYGLAGAAGAWLLLDGVLAAVAGSRAALGLPPAVPVLLGLLVLVGLALALARLSRGTDARVLDPRTGVDLAPPLPRWVTPLMLAPVVLSLALGVLVAVLAG